MPDNQINYGDEIIGWEVPEYESHERTRNWYIISVIVFIFLTLYSVYGFRFLKLDFHFDYSDFNPLFLFILIMSGMITIIHDGRQPDLVPFSITSEGIVIGSKFYDYDEVKDFALVYKPKAGVKNLYFEFKSPFKHRLSIPLFDKNPLLIRENLLKYLKEDLERTDQPLSEGLAKLFKL